MKITREIKTAILVIASILLFIWGYSFLKGQNLFNSHKKLFVEYDNVEGLATSAPVTVSGKVIGKVNSIVLNTNGKLLVELQIDDDQFPISKTSVAQIYEPGVIAGKQIAIIPNYKDNNMTSDGDKLLSGIKLGLTDALGQKLEPLQARLDKVLANADALISNINTVLDAQTQANLKTAIAELNKTMSNFSKVSKNVDDILVDNKEKLGSAVANLDKTTQNFAKISSDLDKANLGATVKNLEATLDNVNKIMTNLESGKGTMGKLLKDDAMYTNLSKASKELELLLQDVRLHPTRYVNVSLFGKKEKPYVEQPVQK
ncbi:phospholipid/cholesterol/gamma-HCH transport system substrate-binding protein [Flavobacterium swingsii]|uniref:Phospholipid/cholesterol/gamma-HCH transport system substrate-binding protein n=1 Tax=Flavobacterium swingsii TaxID=498292 RepID=A0A1I0WTH1_9FLAO|nr:MlaD family protein [Flavobacterium swingsii]SFA91727.1 phospholipid/cholesterol/gamma-HCH transport system substrate-binding protein [Flavobacterium swingsii]